MKAVGPACKHLNHTVASSSLNLSMQKNGNRLIIRANSFEGLQVDETFAYI